MQSYDTNGPRQRTSAAGIQSKVKVGAAKAAGGPSQAPVASGSPKRTPKGFGGAVHPGKVGR